MEAAAAPDTAATMDPIAIPAAGKRVSSTSSRLPVPRKQQFGGRNLKQTASSDALPRVAQKTPPVVATNANTNSLRPLAAAAAAAVLPKLAKKNVNGTNGMNGNHVNGNGVTSGKPSTPTTPTVVTKPGLRKVASKSSIPTPTKSTFAEPAAPRTPTLAKAPPRVTSTAAQRRASAVYLPTASTLAKKISSTNLSSTQTISRRASASHLPSASTLSRKASTPILNRKPSTNLLNEAPSLNKKSSTAQLSEASTSPSLTKRPSAAQLNGVKTPLAKKPSTTQLQPPALTRRASNSVLNRKPSATQLNLPPANPDITPTPRARRPSAAQSATPKTPTQIMANKPTLQKPAARRPLGTSPAKAAPKPAATLTSPPPAESAAAKKAKAKAASQTLRDTIAKARAARMAAMKQQGASGANGANGGGGGGENDLSGFVFDTEDPFNQGSGGQADALIQRKVKSARTDGRLNIAALELKEIPEQVYKMYQTKEGQDDDDDGPKWYESVDLTRLVAADNDIVEVGEELVQIFGGLTVIDMHNNLLTGLPNNLPALRQLTALNLTNNKLETEALDVIVRISTLIDLKIGKNCLDNLPEDVDQLRSLETLEIQGNKLKFIPESLGNLIHLRSLDVSNNALDSVPFEALKECPLVNLNVSYNFIKGTLVEPGVGELKSLQSFDLRGNRITSLCNGPLALPSLQQFFASNNELSTFPSVSEWTELIVFVADYNQFEELPGGMIKLTKLRTIDFTANSITFLEPALGSIESLEVLKFDGNPLRERSLMGMNSADLKRTLKGRLAPEMIEEEEQEKEEETIELRPGGVLELSKKDLGDIPRDLLECVNPAPLSIEAHHNSLVEIPRSVEMFTASLTLLNLSHCKMSGDNYLPRRISLRWLTTLAISTNSITSVQPLIDHLDAPRLEQLDISANRITDITGLRPTFSMLVRLYARENQIVEIPVDTVDGIQVLDLSSNAIVQLPYKLGLVTSLRELRVEGNVFRVPRWQILEKGTESVLAWLRDKLPPEDSAPDLLDTVIED